MCMYVCTALKAEREKRFFWLTWSSCGVITQMKVKPAGDEMVWGGCYVKSGKYFIGIGASVCRLLSLWLWLLCSTASHNALPLLSQTWHPVTLIPLLLVVLLVLVVVPPLYVHEHIALFTKIGKELNCKNCNERQFSNIICLLPGLFKFVNPQAAKKTFIFTVLTNDQFIYPKCSSLYCVFSHSQHINSTNSRARLRTFGCDAPFILVP